MFVALEVCKVPARSHKVGSHPLDGVHEHSGASKQGCFAAPDDGARGLEPWPEPMNDITIGIPSVRSEVRETSLRTFANLETWYSGGSLNIQKDFKAITGAPSDRVRFLELGSRGGFMSDGELIRFAGTLVFTEDEVGNVDGFPGRLLRVAIVNLDY